MGRCLFMRKGETHSAPNVGLPSGYTELTYIQSSGTQYIDTEFKPNQNSKVVVDVQFPVTPTTHSGLFGARNTNTNQFWAYYRYTENAYSGRFGTTADKTIAFDPTERVTVALNSNVFTVNESSISANATTFESEYELCLFAVNNAGTIQYSGSFKLYSCQIYDNGTLVRDFVPCINPNGEVGLYDKVNKKFYGNAGTGVFSSELDFTNYTWAEIIEACQTNTVPSTWQVGDQKAMTVNGTSYLIDIIGKNHDTYATGGTAPLTFQMHDCYGTKYSINSSITNSGGWTSCPMRNTHLPAILKLMPSEVQNGIREVNKLTSAGSQSSTINTTADKLFLLSEIEVFGSAAYSIMGEGTQYAYYKAGNSKVKKANGSASTWWERSPSKNATDRFCGVTETGTSTSYQPDNQYGVAFAFCF